MWISVTDINYRYDIYSEVTAREKQRAGNAAVYCICWPEKGVRYGVPTSSLHSPREYRMLPKLLQFVKKFHDGMRASVQYGGMISSEFNVENGVKQGCVLAQTLYTFGIYFALLLDYAFGEVDGCIRIKTRLDGSFFQYCKTSSKNKNPCSTLSIITFRWRRYSRRARWTNTSAAGGQSSSCLWGLSNKHQCKEDWDYDTGRSTSSFNSFKLRGTQKRGKFKYLSLSSRATR